jgi:hypothetical protein
MNQHPEIQQHLSQQQPANQLPYTQSATTTEAVITPPLGQIDTVALVQYGGITAAIILSIAVLIFVLAEYNKVFVPVMLHKANEKTKPQSRRKLQSKK